MTEEDQIIYDGLRAKMQAQQRLIDRIGEELLEIGKKRNELTMAEVESHLTPLLDKRGETIKEYVNTFNHVKLLTGYTSPFDE